MSTREVVVKARGKINLTLDITGIRPDGFHEVEMIMQSIALHDTITLRPSSSEKIILHGEVVGVAAPEDNLMYKAAKLFFDKYKISTGVEMILEKRLPVAAGLAGGSSDAGAVLKGLRELFKPEVTTLELCELGAQLGSDIPFTIVEGTMLATGRGEILTPCQSKLQAGVVLVKPEMGISTPWAYKAFDNYSGEIVRPEVLTMQEALAKGDLIGVNKALSNVFEAAILGHYDELRQIKNTFKNLGHTALMSGSGPTIFSLVKDFGKAEEVAAQVAKVHPTARVFATELLNK